MTVGVVAARTQMIRDAQEEEWRKLGVRKSSPIDTELTGGWVEKYKGIVIVESNIKVCSKCSVARKN